MGSYQVMTDSGGLQKEAYFHRVPCITLRNETEWTETVKDGWNLLTGNKTDKIINAFNHFKVPENSDNTQFGEGNSAQEIVNKIVETL